jgi:hypothetical protein
VILYRKTSPDLTRKAKWDEIDGSSLSRSHQGQYLQVLARMATPMKIIQINHHDSHVSNSSMPSTLYKVRPQISEVGWPKFVFQMWRWTTDFTNLVKIHFKMHNKMPQISEPTTVA